MMTDSSERENRDRGAIVNKLFLIYFFYPALLLSVKNRNPFDNLHFSKYAILPLCLGTIRNEVKFQFDVIF